MDAITVDTITAFLLRVGNQGETTQNQYTVALKSFFAWLKAAHPLLIDHDLVTSIKLNNIPKPEPEDLLPDEVSQIWQAVLTQNANPLEVAAVFSQLQQGVGVQSRANS